MDGPVEDESLNAPEETPANVGRYEILHEIARGGMATVYLARARGVAGFERLVAVKCCHPHLRREDEFAAMFLDEARLAALIHHPNVVSTIDVGEAEARSLYIVMEFIDGYPLVQFSRAARDAQQPIPINVALRIMVDTLMGLHAAHELTDGRGKPLNLVHRDVSPQNILVGVDGAARITDFGVAKAEARLAVTGTGQVKGKLSYMPPEQLSIDAEVTRRADVYAAGVVLWEMLANRRLFLADSDVQTLNLVLRGSVPRLMELREGLDEEIERITTKALDRDQAQRFASALDMLAAIETSGVPIATAREVAAYVNRVMARPIAERRDLLRKLNEASADTPAIPVSEVLAGLSFGREVTASATVRTLTGTTVDGRLAPRRLKRQRRFHMALAFAGAVLLVLVGAMALGIRPKRAAPRLTAPPARSAMAAIAPVHRARSVQSIPSLASLPAAAVPARAADAAVAPLAPVTIATPAPPEPSAPEHNGSQPSPPAPRAPDPAPRPHRRSHHGADPPVRDGSQTRQPSDFRPLAI